MPFNKEKLLYKNDQQIKKSKNINFKLSKIKCSQKVIELKRVTKVVKGGKIMTYRAIVILGNNNNKVGIGIGSADDAAFAIKKACANGKQNLIIAPITKEASIPAFIKISYGASKIIMRPANEGNGIKASGSIKTICEYAGIKNVSIKQFGSNNILNNVKATFLALIALKEKVELLKTQSSNKYKIYTKLMKNIKI